MGALFLFDNFDGEKNELKLWYVSEIKNDDIVAFELLRHRNERDFLHVQKLEPLPPKVFDVERFIFFSLSNEKRTIYSVIDEQTQTG